PSPATQGGDRRRQRADPAAALLPFQSCAGRTTGAGHAAALLRRGAPCRAGAGDGAPELPAPGWQRSLGGRRAAQSGVSHYRGPGPEAPGRGDRQGTGPAAAGRATGADSAGAVPHARPDLAARCAALRAPATAGRAPGPVAARSPPGPAAARLRGVADPAP